MSAPIFTKEHFAAWVSKQSGAYRYFETCGCAFAEYLHGLGFENVSVGGDYFSIDGKEIAMERDMVKALLRAPHTYEALAERLA